MENTQNTQSTINAAAESTAVAQSPVIEAKAESKPKRAYHRLTDEEKAQRAKRAEKKAAAEAAFTARRNVEFDVSAIKAAAADLASLSEAKVSEVRAKINALAAAVKDADKLMHHRSKSTTITVK